MSCNQLGDDGDYQAFNKLLIRWCKEDFDADAGKK